MYISLCAYYESHIMEEASGYCLIVCVSCLGQLESAGNPFKTAKDFCRVALILSPCDAFCVVQQSPLLGTLGEDTDIGRDRDSQGQHSDRHRFKLIQ